MLARHVPLPAVPCGYRLLVFLTARQKKEAENNNLLPSNVVKHFSSLKKMLSKFVNNIPIQVFVKQFEILDAKTIIFDSFMIFVIKILLFLYNVIIQNLDKNPLKREFRPPVFSSCEPACMGH